jgi:hypothetical protein
MKSIIIPAALALLIGFASGWSIKSSLARNAARNDGASQEESANKKSKLGATDAEVKLLRARIKELEFAISSKKSLAVRQTAKQDSQKETKPRAAESGIRNYVEQMKKDRPEEYSRMTNEIARVRRERGERNLERIDFFASVDTSQMSDEAKAVHTELQSLLQQRIDLESEAFAENAAGTDRREVFRRLGELDRDIRRLNKVERQTLMQMTVKSLGLTKEASDDLLRTVSDIYEATELSYGQRRPRQSRGPRRGGR